MRRTITYLLLCCGAWLGSNRANAQSVEIADLHRSLPYAKDSLEYVDMLNQLGMYHHLGNADSCFWFAVKAREIATRLQYKKGMAGALKNLGIFYSQKLNIQQAIAYEQEALELYRQAGDSANVCHILNNLSIDYEESGDTAREHDYLRQAMYAGSRLDNDSMFSLVLSNYILEYGSDSTRQDSVQWAYQKLQAITARYPYSREWLYAKMFEAIELVKDGRGRQGEQLIHDIADTAIQKGFLHLAIAAYFRIIDDFIPLGYNADSMVYTARIFRLAERAGYYDIMMSVLPSLYRHYAGRQDSRHTAYYGNAMLQLARHQLGLRKSSQEINYMRYFLKEQEMRSLQLQNQVQRQAIEQSNLQQANRRLLIWGLSGLLLLLLVVAAVYYRFYRASWQYERRLAAMNITIAEKNRQLKANDDFKNKLISVVAHDFRNPLNNIIRMAALLQSRSLSREEMMRIIEQVETASGKTLAVFDSILRWIKSQLSGFVYAPAPCPVNAMMTDARQSVQQAAAEKQVSIAIEVPDDIQVAAEREMLQFAHRSLLHHAVTLAAQQGRVVITAQEAAGAVKVLVTVPQVIAGTAMSGHLFGYRGTAYYQQHKPDDAELALIICRDFMDKMGGHISARREGEGMVFEYELPSFH
ncbi:sensor histidine kinase [Chitinophaga japonensis]|uniref:histidine kinase n=1 Tax=Chitinophaga japonensis TaxID=104662 RepID=A0A562TCM4_CHIJA|nr:tetratricopeptide repeat-containing sensor histidine kinase [Chitinophaga japonensis]TWI90750.1 signal transduction histidine kinase [Chitinophaga japonensis]